MPRPSPATVNRISGLLLQPIDPEAIRAKAHAVCAEEQPAEADCARLMAQVEKNIDLFYRLQGLDATAAASRRQRLQQALNPVGAVTAASPRGRPAWPARSVRPVPRPGCEAAVFSICSHARATRPPQEVAMRPVPDDEFKLRFPVAKDRTLRRIAILRIVLTLSIPGSFIMAGVSAQWSRHHDPRWPDIYGEINQLSIYYLASLLLFFAFIVFVVLLTAINIMESSILTRRYGWRAMSDPIEAQRIAMREALYDVTTGSTRADVEPEREGQGDRIMIVPVRRLRPIGARLELTAEREKERASRETRPTQ